MLKQRSLSKDEFYIAMKYVALSQKGMIFFNYWGPLGLSVSYESLL